MATLYLCFAGDSAELWVTLNAMGYNYNLEQDEAAMFKVLLDLINLEISTSFDSLDRF